MPEQVRSSAASFAHYIVAQSPDRLTINCLCGAVSRGDTPDEAWRAHVGHSWGGEVPSDD